MNSEPSSEQTSSMQPSIFRNTLSTVGLVIAVGGVFSFLLLVVMDAMAQNPNPYVGILTWMVAPGFIIFGLFLFIAGAWLKRRSIRKATGSYPPLRLDLSLPRSRRAFGFFIAGALFFLLLSAIGSYQTYLDQFAFISGKKLPL